MAFDIDRFRVEKRYRNTAPVSELMEDLGTLTSFDLEMEARHARWRHRGLMTGAIGGLFFVARVLWGRLPFEPMLELGDTVVGAGFVVGVVSLVLAGVFLVKARSHSHLDLENRRYTLPGLLLRRLGRDIAPEEPVSLELDFRGIDHEAKKKKAGKAGEWKTQDFEDPWMSLQARLRDGTHLRVAMAEWLQKRSRTRRNPRGKYKTKHKQKGATYLQVQLRVKPERHPSLARLGDAARKAVKLPPTVVLTKLEVAGDRLGLRTQMDSTWEAAEDVGSPARDATRTCLMMLLSLYQVLNYSTSLRKQLPARASS